ncbi:hypothetical protein [Paracoccus sp. SM22M-07]|uniref:hypothetical protein n=1 Tax=Paracoccus sp. SM22M-07 TaxID=1520813 RepID=UPI00197E61B2|nr:hypothetical protein [Paracoccus sp. SM22M-07]
MRTRKSKMVAKGSHGPLIRIGGLSLLSETNSDNLWNIASYHHPDSITWRWILSFSKGRRFRGDDGKWPRGWFVARYYRRTPDGFLSEVCVLFGSISFTLHRQKDMKRGEA